MLKNSEDGKDEVRNRTLKELECKFVFHFSITLGLVFFANKECVGRSASESFLFGVTGVQHDLPRSLLLPLLLGKMKACYFIRNTGKKTEVAVMQLMCYL